MITTKINARMQLYQKQKEGIRKQSKFSKKTTLKGLSSLAILAGFNGTPIEVYGQTNCTGTGAMNVISNPTVYGYPGSAIDLDGDNMVDISFFVNPASTQFLVRPPGNVGQMCLGLLITAAGCTPASPCGTSGCLTNSYAIDTRDVFAVVETSGAGTSYGFIEIRTTGTFRVDAFGSGYNNIADIQYSTSTQTCPDALLPVELLSFKADVLGKNQMQLNWQTASETNNAGFELQRSTDGKIFQNLTFIEGKGTTQVAQDYVYDDKDLRQGQLYYYRLKQLDFDGAFEYSEVVTARLAGDEVTGIFAPNPVVAGQTVLSYSTPEAGELVLRVFDVSGKELLRETKAVVEGSNRFELDFSDLGTGMFFVKMEQGGRTAYEKVVVE